VAIVFARTSFKTKVIGYIFISAFSSMSSRPDLTSDRVHDGVVANVHAAMCATTSSFGNEISVQIINIRAHDNIANLEDAHDLERVLALHFERCWLIHHKHRPFEDLDIAKNGQDRTLNFVEKTIHGSSVQNKPAKHQGQSQNAVIECGINNGIKTSVVNKKRATHKLFLPFENEA
jgi:hypothetical protein